MCVCVCVCVCARAHAHRRVRRDVEKASDKDTYPLMLFFVYPQLLHTEGRNLLDRGSRGTRAVALRMSLKHT